MNQAVRALGEVHEVLAKLRVSGNNHGVPHRIDAISKRRFHSSMIDEKRGDSRQTIIVDFPLCDFLRINFDSFRWKRIGRGLTNVDIKSKCLNKVLHHARSPLRTPDS